MTTTITIHPDYEHLRELFERLAAEGVPNDATLIYQARNRVYTYPAPDGTMLNIKAFKHPSAPNRWVYTTLRHSKARRSYENSLRLSELGITTATPVGYIEQKDGMSLGASYYVSLQEPGQTVRDWETLPDSDGLIMALARMIGRMHTAGVWHKDLSPGNILFRRHDDGSYDLWLIDVNRMRFGVRDRRRLMTNFKAIHLDDEQMLRLARAYAEVTGQDIDEVCRQALRAAADYRRARARKYRLKHLLKS